MYSVSIDDTFATPDEAAARQACTARPARRAALLAGTALSSLLLVSGSLGIDMITTASVDIRLRYDLDLADDYTANAGMLKIGYRF